jgi:hypothetical protein
MLSLLIAAKVLWPSSFNKKELMSSCEAEYIAISMSLSGTFAIKNINKTMSCYRN